MRSDLIFPPWLLATPAEKVSRTQLRGLCAGGGRCVFAEIGRVRQECMWLAHASQRREKVRPCKTWGGHVCVGDSERQGKGKVEVNEESVMLGSGPGSCPPYFTLLSLLFGEVKVARQFPSRIN